MLLVSYHLLDIILLAEIERTVPDIGTGSSKDYSNQSKTQKQYEGNSKCHYMQKDHHMNHGSYQKQQMMVILWTTEKVSGYLCYGRRKVVEGLWGHKS